MNGLFFSALFVGQHKTDTQFAFETTYRRHFPEVQIEGDIIYSFDGESETLAMEHETEGGIRAIIGAFGKGVPAVSGSHCHGTVPDTCAHMHRHSLARPDCQPEEAGKPNALRLVCCHLIAVHIL